jgi:hypothetical protein
MIDELKKRMVRDKEVGKAICNAAYLFCPAFQVAGLRRLDPCMSCKKEAARVLAAFFAELPAGPTSEKEVRPVAESIMNAPGK